MDMTMTNGRVEKSDRTHGVVFDAECEMGAAEFVVTLEALADLVGGHAMRDAQYLLAYERHTDEIGEAVGKAFTQGRLAPRGRLTVISGDELPGTKPGRTF
jgi:hypothetical protein